MKGIIGRKLGMTQVWNEAGQVLPVTVIEAGPCVVVQKKTPETDGYFALQLGFKEKNPRRVNRPLAGHFKKAGVTPQYVLKEFRDMRLEQDEPGTTVDVSIFNVGEKIKVTGFSKGRGFTGVMKRHGFHGGHRSHGKSDQLRASGSIGASAYPSRVWPGQRMAGRHGNRRVTVRNLEIVAIDTEKNLLMVKGAVPGPRNGYLFLRSE